jgi:uncharacterized membrane protein YhhN
LRNHIVVLRILIPAISGVFAALDWLAVGQRRRVLEWVCKPAVMVFLIWWALVLDVEGPAGQRWWFVAALAFSLAGDVFLMLPKPVFLGGLASFLVGHVCYAAGFLVEGYDGSSAAELALLAGGALRLGGPILRSVSERGLQRAVVAYMTVISVMVALAAGTGDGRALAGAVLFYVSDAQLAWNKFKAPLRWGKLRIIVTYHVAQFLLVWSLAW